MAHGIRRRTRRDILASILERLVKAPSTHNSVMTSTNLNREAAGVYLREMISLGLVQILSSSEAHKVYSTTEKGKRWLRIYKSLLEEEESKD